MALLVTLFLVLVNIFNTVTTNTPKAEGLTAIEAWMLSCILFVFASLVEYAGLLFSKDQFETPIEVEPPANPPEQDWIETDPCRSVFTYGFSHYNFVSNTGLPNVFTYLQLYEAVSSISTDYSPVTPNCNNSEGGNNGVELRDLNNPTTPQTSQTPEELTGLTEHLRRQTSKHQCLRPHSTYR